MRSLPKVLLTATVLNVQVFAQSELTRSQYQTELTSVQEREVGAREQIAQEQSRIQLLKKELAEKEKAIAAKKQKKYSFLGIQEQDVVVAESELDNLLNTVRHLAYGQNEDQQSKWRDIEVIETRLSNLQESPVSNLKQISEAIKKLESMISEIKSSFAVSYTPDSMAHQTVTDSFGSSVHSASESQITNPSPDTAYLHAETYVVKNSSGEPETLFKIAAAVYGDPYEWPKIYRANQDKIDAYYQKTMKSSPGQKYSKPQDLIFPGLVLIIPR